MSTQDDFIAAVRGGDASRVAQLLESDPSLADARSNGVSALLLALYMGQKEIAKTIATRHTSFGKTVLAVLAIGGGVAVYAALQSLNQGY